MTDRTFIYKLDDKSYVVNVKCTAFQRSTYFRFKNGEFHISTNRLTSNKAIIAGLDKFARKLLKEDARRNELAYSFMESWVYLFGEKIDMPEEVNEKNINLFLKKELKKYLEFNVREYETKMKINEPYKISVRNMKTRYGSNSLKTHTLSFQQDLVHFSPDIINSVIVHELAHYFYRDHSKKFYDVIYKECPNYWDLKKKLRRRIYK